jgi:ElaB/YqjD/DUF883 family membrane-anchored ribosome-binding protein
MNENTIEGGLNVAAGKVESFAGRLGNDPAVQAGGELRQAGGQIQDSAGKAQDAITQIADAATAAVERLSEQATATVKRVSEQARDAYGKASEQAQKVTDTVDPFVKDQPYAALGVAAGIGLVLGLLAAGRGGPRVVYVRGAPRA